MSIRTVLVTQGASRVVAPLLNEPHANVIGIVESAPRGFDPAKKRSLKYRVAQRLFQLTMRTQSLKRIARLSGIPYFNLHKHNVSDFTNWLSQRGCDLMVVYSMSQLLPQTVLNIPPLGVLNLHPSVLPSYRGPNPWFWAYYHQDSRGGVTLHYLNAGEDTGDIVYQKEFDIPLGIKSTDMQDIAIGKHGVEMLLDAIRVLSAGGALPRVSQPANSPTVRARTVKASEHNSLIDWADWPIERVWHVMRGTEGWLDCVPPPTGFYRGQRWTVLEMEKTAIPDGSTLGSIGKDAHGPYVACRDGRIRLGVRLRLRPIARSLYQRMTQ